MRKSNTIDYPVRIIILVYMAIALSVSFLIQFYVPLNDFWGLLLISRKMDSVEQLYNGFFPIGYLIELKLLAFTQNQLLIFLTLARIGLTGLLLWKIFQYFHETSTGWKIIVAFILFSTGQYFEAQFTFGPYWYFVVFASLAVIRTFTTSYTKKNLLTSGILVGISGLFRYHALVVILLLFIVVFFTTTKSDKKNLLFLMIGFIIGWLPQIVVHLLSNHGIFEFNYGLTAHGHDWNTFNPSDGQLGLKQLGANPQGFLQHSWRTLSSRWLLVLTSSLGLLIKDKRWVYFSLLYLLIASISNSPRVTWLLSPILAIIITQVLFLIRSKLTNKVAPVMFVLIGCMLVLRISTYHNSMITVWMNNSDRQQQFTEALSKQALTVDEVLLTNPQNWTYTNTYPFRPHTDRGWTAGVQWLFDRYKQPLRNRDQEFMTQEGIHVLLTVSLVKKGTVRLKTTTFSQNSP